MTQNTRMGLIAGSIVLGGAGVLLTLTLVVVLARGGGGGGESPGRVAANASVGWPALPAKRSDILSVPPLDRSEEEMVGDIVKHRWWKVPPTRQQLAELVQFIGDTNGTKNAVVFDSKGYYCRVPMDARDTKEVTLQGLTPADLTAIEGKTILYRQTIWGKRPRSKVLLTLLSYLDDETSDSFGRQR